MRYDFKKKYPDGECAICLRQGPLVDDHDHASGFSRDGVCRSCNAGLGFFHDSPRVMRRAARYIERHRKLHDDLTIHRHLKPSMGRPQ